MTEENKNQASASATVSNNNKPDYKRYDNPQQEVIHDSIAYFRKLEEKIDKIVISTPIDEKDYEKRIASLRERQQALIYILTQGDFFRNLNNSYLDIFYEIPQMAERALKAGRNETAIILAMIWEKEALAILKEAYPDMAEMRRDLWDKTSRMVVNVLPGSKAGSFSWPGSGSSSPLSLATKSTTQQKGVE